MIDGVNTSNTSICGCKETKIHELTNRKKRSKHTTYWKMLLAIQGPTKQQERIDLDTLPKETGMIITSFRHF